MTLQRAEALRGGCTDAALRNWVDAGWLRRCGFGAYVLTGAITDDDPPWAAKRALHLRTARAVITGLLDSYLVGSSAALAHGLAVLSVSERVLVSRRHRVRSRRVGIHTRPAWGEGPIMLDGVPV